MRRFEWNQQGFTLVELMAAVLITVVIVAATMTTVVTSNRANVVNTQVADTQQNVRLAIDLLSRDIKLAGFNYNATDPATDFGGRVQCHHRRHRQAGRTASARPNAGRSGYRAGCSVDGAAGDEYHRMDADGGCGRNAEQQDI